MTATAGEIHIYGEAEWGIMHGLESLSQMIHSIDGKFGVNETFITDFPRFGFRGMLIDTSRHFLPISTIKAMISALRVPLTMSLLYELYVFQVLVMF